MWTSDAIRCYRYIRDHGITGFAIPAIWLPSCLSPLQWPCQDQETVDTTRAVPSYLCLNCTSLLLASPDHCSYDSGNSNWLSMFANHRWIGHFQNWVCPRWSPQGSGRKSAHLANYPSSYPSNSCNVWWRHYHLRAQRLSHKQAKCHFRSDLPKLYLTMHGPKVSRRFTINRDHFLIHQGISRTFDLMDQTGGTLRMSCLVAPYA